MMATCTNLPARLGGPKSTSAFCHPSEVQVWADGKAPDGTHVISLSHCWESREHCDPYGYQVSKLPKALKGEEWIFIDYVSLYQFQRLSQQQNLSFGRARLDSEGACRVMAVQHMHVLHRTPETEILQPGESLELIQRHVIYEKPLLSRKSLG